ncbi:MAG: SUMF1/EgtB/PvdO family nonheme iron enzyme, partial [Desulfobulbaceae bacterium]|nr:SUMF1/EgtB/PvdO family nonheme iron enzyme [Desulfobulbaceae bacterium]
MEFISIKGGCYEMGCGDWTSECSKDEKPTHKVCVENFQLGKYEVTQGQWQTIMGYNPATFPLGNN